jgi:ATP-dependent RNA helicase UAP56/SUB2
LKYPSGLVGNNLTTVLKLQPKEILIDMDKLSLHGLSQFYVKLEESQKTRKLTDLMDILDFNQVIIFVRDKKRAHSLNKILQESKFPSIELHSDMEATDRYVLLVSIIKRNLPG